MADKSDALWIKRGNAIAPADPVTQALLDGYKENDYVRTSMPFKPRNPKHHRLMMAILSKVVEHTWPRFADVERLMFWLKLMSGMVKAVYVVEGVEKLDMESISFTEMDETAFKALHEKWMEIICTELMPGTDPESLLREVS